jgi:SAM-dependent methyltransferase
LGNYELKKKYLRIATKEGLATSEGNLAFYLDYLFHGIHFLGKSMIDIGSGSGIYSFYAAIMGAKDVVCLEPEAEGSNSETLRVFKQLSRALSLNNISLQRVRFQDFEPCNKRFDIILLHASINHLDEQACIKLRYDEYARMKYGSIFEKLNKIAKPSAKLVVFDCSRFNFFASLGIKNPFFPMIEWQKHQSPEFWRNMLSNYGFTNAKISWASFSFLRKPARILLGNRFAAYFLSSSFLLVMEKNSELGKVVH